MVKKYDFGDSIAPQSIQRIIKNPTLINKLVKWQNQQYKNLNSAIKMDGVDDFIRHFKYKIKKPLKKEKLYDTYFEHIKSYLRKEEDRIISTIEDYEKDKSNIQIEHNEFSAKNEYVKLIRASWKPGSRTKLAKEQKEVLKKHFIEYYKLMSRHQTIYIKYFSNSFFVVEYNCKYLASLGCYRFAKNVAESKIITHQNVWKALKNIAGYKKEANCNHCFTRDTCKFGKRFTYLSNLYVTSIKLRMLSDYTEIFSNYINNDEIGKIIEKSVIPSIKEIHKFTSLINNKGKIMWSPITDLDLGII